MVAVNHHTLRVKPLGTLNALNHASTFWLTAGTKHLYFFKGRSTDSLSPLLGRKWCMNPLSKHCMRCLRIICWSYSSSVGCCAAHIAVALAMAYNPQSESPVCFTASINASLSRGELARDRTAMLRLIFKGTAGNRLSNTFTSPAVQPIVDTHNQWPVPWRICTYSAFSGINEKFWPRSVF